ncbi:hypothetical protein QWY77_01070, partial [Thalassotalea ponticola]|uniref:hypothetical protein n=1 Tax=Thalassotalea ponticola TaxID=1523392 RepID=UPI0025B4DD0D
KTVGCARASLILANYFAPLIEVLLPRNQRILAIANGQKMAQNGRSRHIETEGDPIQNHDGMTA